MWAVMSTLHVSPAPLDMLFRITNVFCAQPQIRIVFSAKGLALQPVPNVDQVTIWKMRLVKFVALSVIHVLRPTNVSLVPKDTSC
jgi:hypothetical protein